MQAKVEVFNLISQKTRIENLKKYNVTDFDIISKFIPSADNCSYPERRSKLIVSLVERLRSNCIEDTTQIDSYIDQIGYLKNKYFNVGRLIDYHSLDSELLSVTHQSASFPQKLINFMFTIIEKIDLLDFQSFSELIYLIEPLLNVVMQPAVISALGYKAFASCVSLLYKPGGLQNLVIKAFHEISKLNIRDFLYHNIRNISMQFSTGIFRSTLLNISLLSGSFIAFHVFNSKASLSDSTKPIFNLLRIGGSSQIL